MRTILHIDMNSYFASVEQQARPALRGKAIGVTGPAKRSIIVAASVEAKRFGIKTGTQIWEAKKLCPQIILISADCNRYEAITRQFLEIFISKTPLVEIFSIDEAFLDATDRCHCEAVSRPPQSHEIAEPVPSETRDLAPRNDYTAAGQIALQIKQELRQKVGPYIRCSIGIAQNKFMAKLAGEAPPFARVRATEGFPRIIFSKERKKPDSLTIIYPGEELRFLDQFELTDACGIGRGISASLARLKIDSFKKLRAISQTDLTLIFNSYGLKLHNMARGIDNDPVRPYFNSPAPKSISRSKTLPCNTFDKNLISKMLLCFCQNIASELKRQNLLGGSVAVWLRYGDFTSSGQSKTIKNPTHLTNDLYFHAKTVLQKLALPKPVRKIGVYIGNLKPDNHQLYISSIWQKCIVLDQTIDQVNQKYGRQILARSSLVNLNFGGKAPNYGFKKNVLVS